MDYPTATLEPYALRYYYATANAYLLASNVLGAMYATSSVEVGSVTSTESTVPCVVVADSSLLKMKVAH